jgi:hypothetical protein
MTRCLAGVLFTTEQLSTITGCLKITEYQTNPANY